jgi:hypothetical protein
MRLIRRYVFGCLDQYLGLCCNYTLKVRALFQLQVTNNRLLRYEIVAV